jgi:hypothetical protein
MYTVKNFKPNYTEVVGLRRSNEQCGVVHKNFCVTSYFDHRIFEFSNSCMNAQLFLQNKDTMSFYINVRGVVCPF